MNSWQKCINIVKIEQNELQKTLKSVVLLSLDTNTVICKHDNVKNEKKSGTRTWFWQMNIYHCLCESLKLIYNGEPNHEIIVSSLNLSKGSLELYHLKPLIQWLPYRLLNVSSIKKIITGHAKKKYLQDVLMYCFSWLYSLRQQCMIVSYDIKQTLLNPDCHWDTCTCSSIILSQKHVYENV